MRREEYIRLSFMCRSVYSTHEDIFRNRNKSESSVKKLTRDETRLLEPL